MNFRVGGKFGGVVLYDTVLVMLSVGNNDPSLTLREGVIKT